MSTLAYVRDGYNRPVNTLRVRAGLYNTGNKNGSPHPDEHQYFQVRNEINKLINALKDASGEETQESIQQ